MYPFSRTEGLLPTGDTCAKIEVLKQISPLLVSCEFETIRIYMSVGKSFFANVPFPSNPPERTIGITPASHLHARASWICATGNFCP